MVLKSSDFDFLLTKGETKQQRDTRCSLLLRFDPFYSSDRDGFANSNRQSIISSNSNDISNEPKITNVIEAPVNILHTPAVLPKTLSSTLSNTSEENEFISETLPIPELEQNSGANSSADDNNTNNNTTIESKVHINIDQPLISIGNNHSISTINCNKSTVGINFSTDATFIHSAVSILIIIYVNLWK